MYRASDSTQAPSFDSCNENGQSCASQVSHCQKSPARNNGWSDGNSTTTDSEILQKCAQGFPRVALTKLSVAPANIEANTTTVTSEGKVVCVPNVIKFWVVSLAALIALKMPVNQNCRSNDDMNVDGIVFQETIDSLLVPDNESEPNQLEQKVFGLQHDEQNSAFNKKKDTASTLTNENVSGHVSRELSLDIQSTCSDNETDETCADNFDYDLENNNEEEIHQVDEKVSLSEDQVTENRITNEACESPKFFSLDNRSETLHVESQSPSTSKNKEDIRSVKFWCKVCKKPSLNYASYLIHCKSSGDINRQQRKITAENTIRITKKQIRSRRKSAQLQGSSNSIIGKNSAQIRYQLRNRANKELQGSIIPKTEDSSESSSSSGADNDEEDFMNDSDSSLSSSSNSDSEHLESQTKTDRRQSKHKMYYCKISGCNLKTSVKSSFITHQRFHKPGSFPCFFCKFTAQSAFYLALHEKQEHSRVKKQLNWDHCPRCNLKFGKNFYYVRHFAVEHLKFENLDNHNCPICKIVIKKEKMLRMHLQKFHDISGTDPSKVFYCSVTGCSAYFKSRNVLLHHKRQVHLQVDQKPITYDCVLCQQNFENMILLQAHKKLLHRNLTDLGQLVYKTGSGNWICTNVNCTVVLTNAEELQSHLKLHGLFKCSFCDVIKKYAPNLCLHEMTHGTKFNLYKWKCQRCFFGTDNKVDFVNHYIETHFKLQEKSTCTNCGVNCTKIESHMSTFHTSTQNPIKCSQCSAYFVEEWQLLYHRQLQHMPKYECKIATCQMEFRFEIDLQRHQNLHETLPCQFCSKNFDFVKNLALHELEHVADNDVETQSLKCSRCLEKFMGTRAFVSHFVSKHLCLSPDYQRCNICEKYLGTTGKPYKICPIKRHKKQCHSTHHINKALIQRCEKCPAYFNTEKDLTDHKFWIHQENPFCCRVCKASFNNSETIKTHEALHGKHSCKFCGVQKHYAKDLAIHELLQHGEITENHKEKIFAYKCARCHNRPFGAIHSYMQHFLKDHLQLGAKSHRCPVCGIEFSEKYGLAKHTNSYHKIEGNEQSEVHKCNKCSAYFNKPIQLEHHENRVHGKGFICKICDQRFETVTLLQNHKITHKKPEDWKFKCTAAGCSQRFPTKPTLQAHIRSHSNTFVCDVPNCGMLFTTQDEMKLHKMYATNNTHFQASGITGTIADWKKETVKCELCEKDLSRVSVQTHMKTIHLKERPTEREFKCNQCDKTFKQKAGLQSHQVFHEGPEKWKFMCAICSKRCALQAVLDQHMRTHTKEKPFVCQVCGEKYAHRHNLRNHVNSKHKEAGVQDIPKARVKRFYVSRKGKKLGKEFCFIQKQNKQ